MKKLERLIKMIADEMLTTMAGCGNQHAMLAHIAELQSLLDTVDDNTDYFKIPDLVETFLARGWRLETDGMDAYAKAEIKLEEDVIRAALLFVASEMTGRKTQSTGSHQSFLRAVRALAAATSRA